MIKFFNGVPIMINNTITKNSEEEKYYISYNPSHRDYGIDTTALVITIGDNERQVFYILKGNHKEQYENCKNLKDCVAYFVSNEEHAHKISDKFEHQHLI
ncbi:hypothetical protein [Bacillus cereus group sp. TH152-1LC]|uniref:hypothetical protein n=1 Tax=Bacillus cereus group sp. TH152-1LC TaxID=3018060 RepID=UPI0022E375C4|nr:hypothetical protein [Bacillus cereus group sp. TH152-1LC]MDA1675589.1 hypothetical protein [Bacillus cereus group sp. TH152-1LC]